MGDTIETIANRMARHAWDGSDRHRRAQTNFRRVSGSITSVIRDAGKYLDSDDQEALRAAAYILERLGQAAERAKRVSKMREQEQERLHGARRAEAEALLDAEPLVDPGDIEAMMEATVAIEEATHSLSGSWGPLDGAAAGELRRGIGGRYSEALAALARDMSMRNEPVPGLIQSLRERLPALRERAARECAGDIGRVMAVLAAERLSSTVSGEAASTAAAVLVAARRI